MNLCSPLFRCVLDDIFHCIVGMGVHQNGILGAKFDAVHNGAYSSCWILNKNHVLRL